jgi:hypothetical protein
MCILPIVARQRFGENITAAANTHAPTEDFFGSVLLYAVRVVLKEAGD